MPTTVCLILILLLLLLLLNTLTLSKSKSMSMSKDSAPPVPELSTRDSMAFVALGSNLGDSPALIATAMDWLEDLSDQPILRSSLWQSEPVDCPPGSPPFVNAVAAFTPRPEETPVRLLAKLQALERAAGRRPRIVLNEPRPLDLDLIAFGGQTVDTPQLVLPHPRAHLRRFVLQPLAEIAPDLILPGQTQNVRELLAALAGESLPRKLP